MDTTHTPEIHPQFKSKPVVSLLCTHCHSTVTNRGMRAILLGNTNVELFSTDQPQAMELLPTEYLASSCRCKIQDGCCLGCGNVIGYHVSKPCQSCLSSCHNGHYYMFLNKEVFQKEQMVNGKMVRWDCIQQHERNEMNR
jgi:hypothetical protein